MGGGMRGGPKDETAKPLKVWAKVRLAAPAPIDNNSGDEGAPE
jgi:hypothetical protein